MLKPKIIDIEVTTACNLFCKGCPKLTNKIIGHMDFDFFKSVIDRVKKETPESIVTLFLDGEPMLHPKFYEMVKYTIDAKMKCYFTTSGMIWNEELFQLITEKNSFYQIIFSLDGLPCPESKSIEIARPGSDRDKVIDTIWKFGKLKKRKGNNLDMCIKLCERGQDYEEIENWIHHWLKKDFVDYVVVGKMLDNTDTGGMRMFPCRYSDNQFIVIKWDGHIIPCAYHPEMNNTRDYSFGVLDKTTPLLEFYNNEGMTKFRKDQRQGIYLKPCSTCGFAYTGDGMDGVVDFVNPKLKLGKIYHKRDYYNFFYSLKHKRKVGNTNFYPKDKRPK